ncbi:aminodeoxychorismate synthase component I [Niveibacterium sp. SC-1]|uniref:aminodeoxychorismate synthase component I n=1 Tax=Niveibacterium sp. SC-1 TaxID=3135646 RepID=UPI00311D2DCA
MVPTVRDIRMPAPFPSPALSAGDALLGNTPCALFDDKLDQSGARLLRGHRHTLHAWGANEVPGFFAAIEQARDAGAWIALAASYELGYALDAALLPLLPQTGRPLASAWIFDGAELLDEATCEALLRDTLGGLDEAQQTAGITPLVGALDEAGHAGRVQAIQQLIEAGDCYQVNLTFPLTGQSWGHPLSLYARLRERQPVRHGAFIRHEAGWLLSRSPELFVAREGLRLTVRPMKGTAPSGEAARLAASEKDRAENLMIVDLLRNDLGRLAPAGGVRVERLFEIEDYPTLHQMTSTIVAEPVAADLHTIFRALFPCGSVTGAPKIRAMQIIRELEGRPRGHYCGAIGWIAPDGDFSFNVPIRTLELDDDRHARLGVGSGIVADSQVAAEYRECLTKARFLSGLDTDFSLFETLRLAPGDLPYPLLERHLARLQRSAAALGFHCEPEAARTALLELARALAPLAPMRVRIDLHADGQLRLQHAPLDPLPDRCTVVLSPRRLDANDLLLQHKTSRRARYDGELRGAIAQGHFDLLFFNHAGELCEGARSNVFVERGGRLLTPPVRCGLLPGVLREQLLADGRAEEAALSRQDLDGADVLYMANALRGLVRVHLSA